MSDDADEAVKPSVGRVEAFSDGVIAIIITIMVLELHAPEEPGLEHLWRLWPVFFSYALSFAYVGIYWVNHHRLLSHARRVTNALVWTNLLLLLALSLVPFSTAYMGEQHFSRDAVLVYLASMILPALGYLPLQHAIIQTCRDTERPSRYLRQSSRKGVVALLLYIIGVGLTFVSPWLGVGAALVVAVLWFLPHSPFDALFGA